MNRILRRTAVAVPLIVLALSVRLFASGTAENPSAVRQQDGSIADPAGFPVTLKDDLGTNVMIRGRPERIVSGTLMTDEILLSLVDPSRIVALTSFASDPAVSNIASESSKVSLKTPLNVELYVSLAPDLVFLADWSDAPAVKQLEDAGIPVYRLKTPTSLDGVTSAVTEIARAVGEEDKGAALVSWMHDRLDEVRKKVETIPASKRLTVMDYSTWGTSMGRNSTWDWIVNQAGLVNAVAGRTADAWGSVPVSKELLVELDPELLVLPGWVYGDPGGADTFFSSVRNDPALKGLKAVRNGRVIRLPETHRSSTSQYMVLAVSDLARAAYPELFR